MNNQLVVKFDAFILLLYSIAINIFVLVVLILAGAEAGSVIAMLVVVNVFYFSTIVFKTLPTIITIDHSKNLVKIRSLLYLFKKIEEQYPLDKLKCSFQEEVRARGMKTKILRIVSDKGLVLEIMPTYNGWSEKKLEIIFKALVC